VVSIHGPRVVNNGTENAMTLPLELTLRDIPASDAIEATVRKRAEKLESLYDHILGFHVLIESPHRHHHKGKLYRARVIVNVPGGQVVVKRNPGAHASHEDIYVAIRDAFDAAKRQLQDYAARRRGDVKQHRVAPLLVDTPSYGFMETGEGDKVYIAPVQK
jgi:ribosomal subunit interface protein